LANVLSGFQDRLKAFPFSKVAETIEAEFDQEIDQLFLEFSLTPVACASIAQVHKAKNLEGDIVAVKILRPNIYKLVKRDLNTLKLIKALTGVFSAYFKEKLQDIIRLLENCSNNELDMNIEAASCEQLKEQLSNIEGFYVPKVYWDYTTKKVLTIQWIDGIAFSNKKAILESNSDKKQVAKNLVISYFNQIYVHGFFHADMHPGNLFLMENGDIGVVDFGIMGVIDKKTRIAITEILMAFLNHDYEKVAKLHIRAGLVPPDINLQEFILFCRVIGQNIVDKKIHQISIAKLLGNLLKMTRRYQMKTKPELLLLQKTMLLVEGVGVSLDKDLNMWELARPFIKEWATKNIGFDAKIRDTVLELLEAVKKLPEHLSKEQESEEFLMQEIKTIKSRERRWKILLILSVVSVSTYLFSIA
jgi:ubiquinone biosynthesis protein